MGDLNDMDQIMLDIFWQSEVRGGSILSLVRGCDGCRPYGTPAWCASCPGMVVPGFYVLPLRGWVQVDRVSIVSPTMA
jgi:hypothetical protein